MDTSNYNVFRDCFSDALVQRIVNSEAKGKLGRRTRRRKHVKSMDENISSSSQSTQSIEAEDLADFIEYLASEIFESFPEELQTLTYSKVQEDESLQAQYNTSSWSSNSNATESRLQTIPPTVQESLEAYSLLGPDTSLPGLFGAALEEYVTAVTAPPPIWSSTRATECEVCGRDWIPLSYHHLIPKQVHDKALKRGWHDEWRLNSVAWLCRACHSFVHRCESNEVLARDYWTVERLLEREDIQQWAKWVSKVRWKAR